MGGIPLFVFEIVSSSSAVSALFISDSAALGTESFSQHSPIYFRRIVKDIRCPPDLLCEMASKTVMQDRNQVQFLLSQPIQDVTIALERH